ncbi:MAG: M20/M25/M40 family metallo-hydrolase [Acidobacteria bacterium]|nr:M20/M25/M40 family metallo-hydrolase [Acidobacteriota bacterium]
MDSVAERLLAFARALIDIDSTTGREQEVAAFISRTLRDLDWHVDEQPLGDGRFNVIARVGEPRVVLSTHFDCVPPFFSSRLEGGTLYGRGACDAKGILAAQVVAAERARQAGRTDVGLLFVAGEERGSDGAKAANGWPTASKVLINGEPTDNRLGLATKGVYRARLGAAGRAAHSSQPELGESAIEKLLDALVALREVAWPADDLLGVTNYSVGLISGGVAPNVIPPDASAELMFRTVGDYRDVRDQLSDAVGTSATIEDVLVVPPVRLRTVPGFDTAVFAYTTDVPFLDAWGTPMLLGPGSIAVAHTDAECVEVAELVRAVDAYERLVAGTGDTSV